MKLFSWRNFWRLVLWGGVSGLVVGIVGIIALALYVMRVSADLPDYRQLAEYEPPVMSRVHAGDGLLIAEYARERRVFVPIEAIPPRLVHAFLSAEDKNFYEHSGLDYVGIARAMINNVGHVLNDRRLEGGSTITQQVAKNFLLSSDQRIERKVREMVLARRIERAFTKDEILELYLNEIFLGYRAYGVAAAALNYFDKPLDDLELHEIAYLAALPKAPNNYHPIRRPEAAIARRNWVLSRMFENGYISEAEMTAAQAQPLEIRERLQGDTYLAAEYFVEQVRREVFERYGEEELYGGGLSIRTTLDTQMQLAARTALRRGLEAYDRRHGYRGPVGAADPALIEAGAAWDVILEGADIPPDIDGSWAVAVVTGLSAGEAAITLVPETPDAPPLTGRIPLSELRWAREPGRDADGFPTLGPAIGAPSDALALGDVILVEPLLADWEADAAEAGEEPPAADLYGLRQYPDVNGGVLALDPFTGRVLAMVGGYSFQSSQFNRAVQAFRQPGSAFKPFVYAAAFDHGYTPASIVLDAPFAASGGPEERFYLPQNYSDRWYGPSTLRLGLELSRNVMTIRLAQDMGIEPVVEYGEAFGVYDELAPVLPMSLGAGETTLRRLVAAYGAMLNGGRLIEPTLIDRVQDRYGETLDVHDPRPAEGYQDLDWSPSLEEPDLPPLGEPVINPVTAYQIVHLLEGAVEQGTGTALRSLERPMGGKTGTTNDFRDAWFVGFNPDLVVGVYVGFDAPRPLGSGEAGGRVAAPIARTFFDQVLDRYPVAPFRVPEGVRLVPVDRRTGEPSVIGRAGVILEAFQPGTEPTRNQTADDDEGLSFGRGQVGSDGTNGEAAEDAEEEDGLGGLY